jgi:hypothetical protein
MGAWNDVDADQFSHPAGGGGAGVGGGFHSAYVAAHGDADQTGADELSAGQDYVGGLHHGVGSFDCTDQTFCFNQAEGLHHISSNSGESLRYHKGGAKWRGLLNDYRIKPAGWAYD